MKNNMRGRSQKMIEKCLSKSLWGCFMTLSLGKTMLFTIHSGCLTSKMVRWSILQRFLPVIGCSLLSSKSKSINVMIKSHPLVIQLCTFWTQLGHSWTWGANGAKKLKLLGTVLTQLRQSWGIKLHGARSGHSWGTVEAWPFGAQLGTVKAMLGRNLKAK